jgi:hypothetical protein
LIAYAGGCSIEKISNVCTMGAVAEEASHASAAPMFETSIESVLSASRGYGASIWKLVPEPTGVRVILS